MSFKPPVKDYLFNLEHLANLAAVTELPGFEDANLETAQAVLEEAAKLASDVIAPLNWAGDQAPSFVKDGVVTTTKGFKEAHQALAEGGWQGLQVAGEYGGQGLPKAIGGPVTEMINGANIAFALCGLLTDGAIEAITTAGSAAQKAHYIPRMASGEWTGTMNLTEPQAGSDLSQVRSKAVKQADGTYRISGQKIYITYGEHDMAQNIIHLVLARLPDAPEGIKGISLFIVPKFLTDEAGHLGARNDVWCASLEHKLGIKASPTAVLLFGDDKGAVGKGAIGYLVGEENRGLEYMFIMMNSARYAVGLQGIGIAEHAYQKAVDYARTRVQGRSVSGTPASSGIIEHPDVRRMLLTMRALTEASRAMAQVAASSYDAAHHSPDANTAAQNQSFYELMVPIVKGFSTEMSLEVASLGVQVHGGMGFIEETGAAQHYRDARILTIYEGTTAIQANDLVGRKTVRDGGAFALSVTAQVKETAAQLSASALPALQTIGAQLALGAASLEQAIQFIAQNGKTNMAQAYAGSVPYLMLAGYVVGAWQLGRAALAAAGLNTQGAGDAAFNTTKINTALFFATHCLPRANALATEITLGAAAAVEIDSATF